MRLIGITREGEWELSWNEDCTTRYSKLKTKRRKQQQQAAKL
jgi:hypothetical protein